MTYAAALIRATPICDHDPVGPGLAIGTRVLTKQGERGVETLRAGDKIITRSHGFQSLRWVGLSARQSAAPIHFTAGALGDHQAITVCPSTRFLIRTGLPNEGGETISRAADLVNNRSIFRIDAPQTRCVHLLFDTDEIIPVAGLYIASLNPAEPFSKHPKVAPHLRLVPNPDHAPHFSATFHASQLRAQAHLLTARI